MKVMISSPSRFTLEFMLYAKPVNEGRTIGILLCLANFNVSEFLQLIECKRIY
jgi:hypothetical protein